MAALVARHLGMLPLHVAVEFLTRGAGVGTVTADLDAGPDALVRGGGRRFVVPRVHHVGRLQFRHDHLQNGSQLKIGIALQCSMARI